MLDFQKEFIDFCLEKEILRFGNFTLKSGRQSPYFFNAGLFNTGEALSILGTAYQKTLENSKISFDIIFGPAYKGIPLACTTACAFFQNTGRAVGWSFNRKEEKSYGDKGLFVGQPLKNKNIALIDDVISAGKTCSEIIPLIKAHQGTLKVICIAVDRQEVSEDGDLSATQSIQQTWKIPVLSIIKLQDLLNFMKQDHRLSAHIEAIQEYREKYGVNLDCISEN